MQYIAREPDSRDSDKSVYQSLEPVVSGMGMSLIELSVYRRKGRGMNAGNSRRASKEKEADVSSGSVQIKAVIYKNGIISIEDCAKVHRGILPRLELAFPAKDIYLEVSSAGIDRLIKDGREFTNYIGRGVRCYRTDISDWTEGVLLAADTEKVVLRNGIEETALPYEIIAKARLNIA